MFYRQHRRLSQSSPLAPRQPQHPHHHHHHRHPAPSSSTPAPKLPTPSIPIVRRTARLKDRRCTALSADFVTVVSPSVTTASTCRPTRSTSHPLHSGDSQSPPHSHSQTHRHHHHPSSPSASSVSNLAAYTSHTSDSRNHRLHSPRFNMLRGVRERFRMLRPRRNDPVPPSTTFSTTTTSTNATALTTPQHHLSDVHQQLQESHNVTASAAAQAPAHSTHNNRAPRQHNPSHQNYISPIAKSPHRSDGSIPEVSNHAPDHHASSHQHPHRPHVPFLLSNGEVHAHVSASAEFTNDPLPQPRVFRNRSLEYGHRRDRQLLGLFGGKGRRALHKGKPIAVDDSVHQPYSQQHSQHDHPYHYPTPHGRSPQQIQQQQQYRHHYQQQRDDTRSPHINNWRLGSPLGGHVAQSGSLHNPPAHPLPHPSNATSSLQSPHHPNASAAQNSAAAAPRLRNEDSFSSLPSTHASRDPFLNDDLPMEISHVERPRAHGREQQHTGPPGRVDFGRRQPAGSGHHTVMDGNKQLTQHFTHPANQNNNNHTRHFTGDGSSSPPPPPSTITSSITSRKRSTVWKRRYDPDAEFQSRHEREILRAVALSETAVKERRVDPAAQLAAIVDEQVAELEDVLSDVDRQVKATRATAQRLPSPTDIRFQQILNSETSHQETNKTSVSAAAASATMPPSNINAIPASTDQQPPQEPRLTGEGDQMERILIDLDWKEKIWDADALIIDKQFEDAVESIETLSSDGIVHQSSDVISHFRSTVHSLVEELGQCCARGTVQAATQYAPLLGRLGMKDHARNIVLRVAEAELLAELRYMSSNSQDVTPRTVNVMLDKTVMVLRNARGVCCAIEESGKDVKLDATEMTSLSDEGEESCKDKKEAVATSKFLLWAVGQCDMVFSAFVAPVVEDGVRKMDPVTILVNEQAVASSGVEDELQWKLTSCGSTKGHARERATQQMKAWSRMVEHERTVVSLVETRVGGHVRKQADAITSNMDAKMKQVYTQMGLQVAKWGSEWRKVGIDPAVVQQDAIGLAM